MFPDEFILKTLDWGPPEHCGSPSSKIYYTGLERQFIKRVRERKRKKREQEKDTQTERKRERETVGKRYRGRKKQIPS